MKVNITLLTMMMLAPRTRRDVRVPGELGGEGEPCGVLMGYAFVLRPGGRQPDRSGCPRRRPDDGSSDPGGPECGTGMKVDLIREGANCPERCPRRSAP